MLPIFLLMGVAFYFFLIRPQKKRQQEQQKMQTGLAPGTRIVTAGGIYGTVVEAEDGDLLVEVAEGIEIRILAQAVARVIEDVEYVEEEEIETGEDEVKDSAERVELTKSDADGEKKPESLQAGDKA
ncbi:MAG: preprotein translocase subunit YajC [Streptosporangiaceae bacterium]